MRIASNPFDSTATLRAGSTFARKATTQNGRGVPQSRRLPFLITLVARRPANFHDGCHCRPVHRIRVSGLLAAALRFGRRKRQSRSLPPHTLQNLLLHLSPRLAPT